MYHIFGCVYLDKAKLRLPVRSILFVINVFENTVIGGKVRKVNAGL